MIVCILNETMNMPQYIDRVYSWNMYIIYRADAVQRLLDNVKNVLQKTRLKLFPTVKKVFNNSNSDALFFQRLLDVSTIQ